MTRLARIKRDSNTLRLLKVNTVDMLRAVYITTRGPVNAVDRTKYDITQSTVNTNR